jgi:hypothetical protein
VALEIPADTVGFEYVTIGQRVRLAADGDFEASAWVRWPDGPEVAPAGAKPSSGHRCAIVSFWARHRDGTGDFAGRDEWLFDNRWRRIAIRFRASEPGKPTFVYVSLLPNQKPAATRVLLDDFELRELGKVKATGKPVAGVARDGSFGGQQPGAVASPWSFARIGDSGIRGEVIAEGEQHYFRMTMGKGTSNLGSAQLWQHITLVESARYEVSCRMRWDNFAPSAPAPIVNYGIYHEESGTWYGPVDQTLQPTAEWRTYRFLHNPPFGGSWKLYVQLNGWGNFGSGVTVSFDDFNCTPIPAGP